MERKNNIQVSVSGLRNLKPLILFVFTFALLYQSIGQLAVMVYYQANKGVISSSLCENRDKPVLQCNGKCYLAKQLEKLEEKEKSEKTVKVEKLEIQFPHNPDVLTFKAFQPEPEKNIFFYWCGYQFDHLSSFFHPPTLSV